MGLSPWRHSRKGFILLSCALLVATIGCGPSAGAISGKVTYNGVLLKGGTVIFHHTDTNLDYGTEIREDGTYSIEQIPLGAFQVGVETESVKARSRVRVNKPPSDADHAATQPDPKEWLQRYTAIPKNYAAAGASGLTFTVTGGRQEYPIDLK
jgi:hypothetical protein